MGLIIWMQTRILQLDQSLQKPGMFLFPAVFTLFYGLSFMFQLF